MQTIIQLDGRRCPLAETEKITINVGPVDLGRIDVVVEQGLYSNRSDLIRTAIRNQLDRHEPVIQAHAVKWSFVLGAETVSRSALEELREKHKKISLRVIGMLRLANDIEPELAMETIEAIRVRGSFHASPALREALADRINTPRT
jgi:Arc/MetJ-type ribon-helix-helix transcriptional regulator